MSKIEFVVLPCTDGAMIAEPSLPDPNTRKVASVFMRPIIAWKIHDADEQEAQPFAEPITTTQGRGGLGVVYYSHGAWYDLDEGRGHGMESLLDHFSDKFKYLFEGMKDKK